MFDDNEDGLSDTRHIKAENAFSLYNFGNSIVSSQSWQESGDEWSKKLKIKEVSSATIDEKNLVELSETKKEITFTVRFEPGSDTVASVSAWDDRSGQEVGYLKSSNRAPNPTI